MREILFRGKRTDIGEWIRGDLIATPFIRNETQQNIIYILDITKADYDCFEDLTEDNGIFEVDPETVCQYTGLTDKNGRKIFEGDIVRAVYKPKDEDLTIDDFVIKWDKYYCRYVGNYVKKEYIYNPLLFESKTSIEVIGNIFDTPERILRNCGGKKNMERLTNSGTKEARNNVSIREMLNKLAEYEDFEEIFRSKMTDAACDFLKDKEEFAKWLDRNKLIAKKYGEYARAYEDLEEQGKLLKLPCAVGDTVWKIKNGKISKWVVSTIKIEDSGISFCNVVYICDISDFGKTVFLAREEAEAALKEA